jgi:hypothetical protein
VGRKGWITSRTDPSCRKVGDAFLRNGPRLSVEIEPQHARSRRSGSPSGLASAPLTASQKISHRPALQPWEWTTIRPAKVDQFSTGLDT